MIANLISPILSFLETGVVGELGNRVALDGEMFGVPLAAFELLGRHLRTASTEALHGCTCSGYENITSMTIAAFATVEATEGISIICQFRFDERNIYLRTHFDDVPLYIVTKRKVSSDSDKDVHSSS